MILDLFLATGQAGGLAVVGEIVGEKGRNWWGNWA
jgi:hypothetical protein